MFVEDTVPALSDECRVFTRYLSGQEADHYVLQTYLRLHEALPVSAQQPSPIDAALVTFARRGAAATRIADAYARFFRPRGLLRHKLTLSFAVLENSPAHHAPFTAGGPGSPWLALGRIACSLALFGSALAIGSAIFGPRHLLQRSRGQDAG